MDVRCEKCQTEYELDESRLKPGGVTVKCTNCGHMFKIRKRTPTNVGLPAVSEQPRAAEAPRTRRSSSKPPVAAALGSDRPQRADSILGDPDAARAISDTGSGPTDARQWMVRLENGENKTCRELAVLQQWIVAGVVTREGLISRTGKTWKRLGDIVELSQYFTIADEARVQRAGRTTGSPAEPRTLLGVGAKASSAGGTILPDDEPEVDTRTTGNFGARRGRTTPPPPPPSRTPPTGAPINKPTPNPLAQTELAPTGAPMTGTRRAPTPPPLPRSAGPSGSPPPAPTGNRSTAMWANSEIKTSGDAGGPQGPVGGKFGAVADEPAFAGRVRTEPADESSFNTGKVRTIDEDDDAFLPQRRGSRAGTVIVVMALLVIAAAAAAVYVVVIRPKSQVAKAPEGSGSGSGSAVAVAPADAAVAITPIIDAGVTPPELSPADVAKGELLGGVEPKLRESLRALSAKDDPDSQALRARLEATLAQSELDRADFSADRGDGEKLRKDAKEMLIEAASFAQRSLKGKPDDAAANLALGDVLRLQGKPARDVKRYLDAARGKLDPKDPLVRDEQLAEAMLAARDGKLDDALKQLAAIADDPADTRVKFQLALIAFRQSKAKDAKPFLDQILALRPDHDGAKALAAKLGTTVVATDPMPHEDGSHPDHPDHADHPDHGTPQPPPETGGDYDSLVAKANSAAENNCTKAMDLFAKALDSKPNGVEALAGMGYCHLDAKQFSSAFSKFRAALAVSPRYEPALSGIAETYQQQGNKDQAIESWRNVLIAYPSSAKAKKQLELLGAGAGDSGGGSAVTPPTPTPTPVPPTPAPAPAAGSAGSAQ